MTRIAYIASLFPKLSETFVYREVSELRRQGMEVACYSIHKPQPEPLPEEARNLESETSYLWPVRPAAFIAAVAALSMREPITFLKTLRLFYSQAPQQFASRKRYLLHFFEGAYLGYLCRKHRIQYIHAHFANGPSSVALAASELTGIPFGFTSHAQDIYADPVMLEVKIDKARNPLTISDYNRRYIAEHITPQASTKLGIQRVSINLNHFSPGRRSENKTPLIVAVGRLVPKKGFDYLIRACGLLSQRDIDYRCWIVGDGPERASLQQLISDNRVRGRVRLLGAQSDIKKFLGRADIFAMPCVVDPSGDRDGIPTTIMEAMAMGLPTVSTTVSAIPELVLHGKNGMLARPNDFDDLAGQIARLIADRRLRARLGQEARRFVIANHNLETNTNILYQRINRAVSIDTSSVKPEEERTDHVRELHHHFAGAQRGRLSRPHAQVSH